MKWKLVGASLLAAIAGIACGHLAWQSISCRDLIGRLFGRGHLMALANEHGIYQADVEREVTGIQDANALDERDSNQSASSKERILASLATNAVARDLAAKERISANEVDRELKLLRSQLRDQRTWIASLRNNSISEYWLRRVIAEDLRTRSWMTRRLGPELEATTEECQQFYHEHLERYAQPLRLRASQLFLAAPPETPPEVVDAKRQTIDSISKRIKDGENFADLVASMSEDEGTKTRGGDLGFFSAYRMPPDFFAAAERIPLGQISQPMRTSLGFHIVQATDRRPARQMTFDETRAEVASLLAGERRRSALQQIQVDLSARVQVVRSFSDNRAN